MNSLTIDKAGPLRKIKYGSMSRESRLGFALVVLLPHALCDLLAGTADLHADLAQKQPLVFTTSTDQLVLPVGIVTTLIKGDVFNWDRRAAWCRAPTAHLSLPDGLLHCRLDRRRDEGLNSEG
jgi:hypothetical protein